MYQIVDEGSGPCVQVSVTEGTIKIIPMDEANTDYQRYLAWVAEGNTPEVIE